MTTPLLPGRLRRRAGAGVLAAALTGLALLVPGTSAPAATGSGSAAGGAGVVPVVPVGPAAKRAPGLRDVMWVGNNWAGTASVVDAHTFQVLQRGVNLVPDKQAELNAIYTDPAKLAFFLAIRSGPGEGHDQFVDDMFTTLDGKYLAVSRPSFADVVWIDIAKALAGRTDSIVREQPMDGHRSDHMALSPDGRRLLVSDSTSRQVIEFSMVEEILSDGSVVKLGDRTRTFVSGETPHESNYSADGQRIYHASIGLVYTPGDDPLLDGLKGDRWFEVVNNKDFSVAERWGIGRELAEAGYPSMSSAVRPMAVAPGERYLYFQVSFFHGFVEFDTQAPDLNGKVDYTLGGVPEPRTGAVTRVVPLPNRVPNMPREQYVNDSAHHGLSINDDGTKLCVAGTMDDYAAIVDRESGRYQILDEATTGHTYLKPYWTTEGLDDTCWISLSGSDAVAVVDPSTGKELAYREVGDHPQRVRHGYVPEALLGGA
ncbi:MAG TPA: serine/threonine protein kinase [Nocardioides sp.]|nr:serine/threonine protein kinase [Nocardioides sp.]